MGFLDDYRFTECKKMQKTGFKFGLQKMGFKFISISLKVKSATIKNGIKNDQMIKNCTIFNLCHH